MLGEHLEIKLGTVVASSTADLALAFAFGGLQLAFLINRC